MLIRVCVYLTAKCWPYLGVPVVSLFKLQVFPSFAAQVQPLPLQPLHVGLPQQVRGVDLGQESDVLTCRQPERVAVSNQNRLTVCFKGRTPFTAHMSVSHPLWLRRSPASPRTGPSAQTSEAPPLAHVLRQIDHR